MASKKVLEKGIEKGVQLGEQKGRQEFARSIARELIANGISLDIVKMSIGLSDTEIDEM